MAKTNTSKGTFDNIQLNQQFRYLGLEDQKSSQSDSPRPTKRQKTTTDLVSTPARRTLDEIIGNLQGLLGSQAAEGLDGLENFAT